MKRKGKERVKKDLILETPGKHFISLIQYKHLDVIRTKWLSSQHIKHTTRSTNNNMNPTRQNALIFTNTCSTNTSMYSYTKIVSKCPHHLLNLLSKLSSGCQDQSLAFRHTIVKLLQNTRAESCCLSSSRLSLLNNIKTLTEGHNSPLLNSRGFFETYTRKYIWLNQKYYWSKETQYRTQSQMTQDKQCEEYSNCKTNEPKQDF